MLRTIFVALIILFGLANVFRGPFYSLLVYLWIAYFRPEYWVWDGQAVQSLNLSWITGLILVGSTLLSQTAWRFDLRALLLVLFVLQDTMSTFASPHASTLSAWQDFAKTIIITYLICVLVDDKRKFRTVILVIALSLGFEAAKQGWAQLVLAPGAKNLNGVPQLGDENETAVGMFMLVPLFGALASTAATKWERYTHRFMAIGIIYRAVVTYSRGGFLTALGMTLVYFVRSPNKLRSLITVAVVATLVIPVLPPAFWDRMSTITVSEDQRNDVSEGRLYFWGIAVRMAEESPLLGVGHSGFGRAYDRYDATQGAYGGARAVHSSWFGVLAELGFPGLILFLANIVFGIFACVRVRKLVKNRPDLRQLALFANALETALVAFAVGGTFVNFQYEEMLWHFIGLTSALLFIAVKATAEVKVPRVAVPAVAQAEATTAVPVGISAASRVGEFRNFRSTKR